jgi:heptosyltransferase II
VLWPAKSKQATLGIVLPTWVGDACMATPTLRALRQAFPQTRLIGVMRPVIRDLLESASGDQPAWLDECVLFTKKPQPPAVSRWGLVRQLKRHQIDVMVLLTNSLWSAAVARLAGIPRIVGYDRDARGWLLSDRVPVLRDGKRIRPISAVDYYLQLAHWIGAENSNRRMQLGSSPLDQQLADALWTQLGFSAEIPTVVINSGAATMATRIWPEANVRELARRIAAELGWQVLLHCGPAERTLTNDIARALDNPRVASMGVAAQLPIGLSKSVLQRADVVVTTDSGPRHIAVALDRPVITLFGPTDPMWTQTYNIHEMVIDQVLDCRPCYQSPCPLKHHRCMQDISVERVLGAVQASVQRRSNLVQSILSIRCP